MDRAVGNGERRLSHLPMRLTGLIAWSLLGFAPLHLPGCVSTTAAQAPGQPSDDGGGLAKLREFEDDRLETLLQRLQLSDLQMLHLEQRVQLAPKEQKVVIAKRLADVYASKLLSTEGQEADALRAKIAALIRDEPRANTASLGVVMMQSNFQAAERNAIRWLNEGDDKARQQAATALRYLAPDLAQRQKILKKGINEIESVLDRPNLSRAKDDELQRQLERELPLMLKASFLAGWAGYYDGIINQQTDSLREAKAMFRQLLGLDQDGAEPTAEWMGIDAPVKARALIGLALAETALGNAALAANYFDLLSGPIVVPEIQDQVGQWHVRSLLNANATAEAKEVAKKYIGSLGSDSTPGKAQLCTTLVQAGFRNNADQELGLMGIQGLARIGEFRLVRQLVEKYRVPLTNPQGFYLRWISSQQQMAKADKSKQEEDYLAATKSFRSTLQAELDAVGLKSIAQCRNEFAWCLYHSKQWSDSGDEYRRAAGDLMAVGDQEAAVKAMWMSFVAYQRGASSAPAMSRQAENALEAIVRDFPESEYARKAKYQLVKFGGGASGALAEMENIASDDPNYLNVKYDICELRHQQWLGARGTGDEPREASALIQAVDEYLSLPNVTSSQRKLKAALLGIEAAADGRPAQPKAVGRLLVAAGNSLNVSDQALLANYHYHALRHDFAAGNTAAAETHAKWLQENPAGAKYEQTALIILAKAADANVTQASAEERPARLQEARRIYDRLSVVLGDSVEVLQDNRNAQVALLKSANYQLQTGKNAEAAARFDKLLKVAPKNRAFIRGAAQAHFRTMNYEKALGYWRDLVRADKEGSDTWYEAKYHQIACLSRVDAAGAARSLQQFEVLYPDPPNPWGEMFQTLARQLSID